MDQTESTDRQPLWRRVADFPLVAMLIAIVLYIMATAAALWVGKLIPEAGRVPNAAIHAAIAIGIMFAVYKSVMRTLGERPHDDLPVENALKYTGLGLLAGFLLFSAVVAVAAFVNVYRIAGYGGTSNLIFSLITIAILPGFMEELLFRGILFRWIEEFAGSWVALILTSALVPPTSMEMILENPAPWATLTAPITPAAGPERAVWIACRAAVSALVTPPFDFMINNGASICAASNLPRSRLR